jgi:hypothetical protein
MGIKASQSMRPQTIPMGMEVHFEYSTQHHMQSAGKCIGYYLRISEDFRKYRG